MHARLDHRLAVPLRDQAAFDRRQDFVVGHGQRVDVEAVEIVDVDGGHPTELRCVLKRCPRNEHGGGATTAVPCTAHPEMAGALIPKSSEVLE